MGKAQAIQSHALTRTPSWSAIPLPAVGTVVRAPSATALGFLFAFVLIAAAWSSTLGEMWLRWFPGWAVRDLDLVGRLTAGGSYYGHAILVPLISVALAIGIHARVGTPARWTRRATAVGWVVLAGFLCLHLLSVYARVTFISGFALIGALAGLVMIWGGGALLGAYWVPIGLLVFMVPLPLAWIADLNLALKTSAVRAALWVAVEGVGIPAVMDGSFVYLSPHPSGEPQVLIVGNVCSGLRNLIALVWFACLFVTVCRVKGGWRLVLLASAGPVAVAANVLRIVTLIVVADHWGVRAAGPESWFHNVSGVVVFAAATGLLVGLERGIIRLGHRMRRDWSAPGRWMSARRPRRISGPAPAMLRPMPLTALTVTAVLSVGLSAREPMRHSGDWARRAVPQSIAIDGAVFAGHDLRLSPRTLAMLETDDYVLRRYASTVDGRMVDLLIVFSAVGRKGTHPPEVCLEGRGVTLTSKRLVDVGLGGRTVCELTTQQAGLRTIRLYVYKCGEGYTTSFLAQQARIFLNGLAGRGRSGALIRVDVPAVGGDVEAARRLAQESLRVLMPSIGKGLP
ncbi:MAG: EpsI family protein [Phycisphaerae bacterium]|nr:EpsI family protein [Phycisphaerae bacterium]